MEGTIYTLILPLVVMVLCFVTKRVILSLGIGIVLGGLMYTKFDVISTIAYLYSAIKELFIIETADGWGLNTFNIFLILFLLILGTLTSLIHINGGNRSFGKWVQTLLKTRVGAQVASGVLGVLIFIDDYFSCIAVGSISQSMTDRFKVSRAKLAYILDSTATPISVLVPLSSWGAFMVGIIGTTMTANGITGYSSIEAFLLAVPMNLYCIFAVIMVFVVACFGINIGPMKSHELRAVNTGELIDPKHKRISDIETPLPQSEKSRVRDLVIPFIVLIVGTIVALFLTALPAIQSSGAELTVLAVFENTKLILSLFYGSSAGLIVAIGFFLTKKLPATYLLKGASHGCRLMLPAVVILLLAFTTGGIIEDLKMGEFLAGLISENVNVIFLPALVFVIAIVIDIAIATAWGTWAIMFPIIGQIAITTDVEMFLPMVGATIAGAIFGDHCSPISDSTILSSTGAGSHHMDHVITQLPYGLIVAGISFLGYIVLGITNNTWLSLLATTVIFILIVFLLKRTSKHDVKKDSKNNSDFQMIQ